MKTKNETKLERGKESIIFGVFWKYNKKKILTLYGQIWFRKHNAEMQARFYFSYPSKQKSAGKILLLLQFYILSFVTIIVETISSKQT